MSPFNLEILTWKVFLSPEKLILGIIKLPGNVYADQSSIGFPGVGLFSLDLNLSWDFLKV